MTRLRIVINVLAKFNGGYSVSRTPVEPDGLVVELAPPTPLPLFIKPVTVALEDAALPLPANTATAVASDALLNKLQTIVGLSGAVNIHGVSEIECVPVRGRSSAP